MATKFHLPECLIDALSIAGPGRPIRDLEGERVASVKDVIVRLGSDDHPPVTGLVARYRRRDFFLQGVCKSQRKWCSFEFRHPRLTTVRATRK